MDAQPVTILVELIRYNNWANQQVFAACRQLSQEQLATGISGAYGTIRETLEHIIRAEAGYVRLLTGTRPQPLFTWDDRPGLDDIMKFAAQVGEGLVDAANHISPTQMVQSEWEGGQAEYQAQAVFIQIINHGIEHRTNITTILNQGLAAPPDVDGWGYLVSNPARFVFRSL